MEPLGTRDRELGGVRAAVEVLYETFKRYQASYPLTACNCGCVEDSDQQFLFSSPLRELGYHQVGRYSGKAITTWGTGDDFKHFLPRILELMVFKDRFGGFTDPIFVISKLVYGEWRSWPAVEQEAIGNFLLAWWRLAVTTHPNESATICCDCVLEAAVRMRFELRSLLELWDEAMSHSLPATLQLAYSARCMWRQMSEHKRVFRDATAEQTRQLLTWLREPCHTAALVDLRQRGLSPDDAVDVQLGCEDLRRLTNCGDSGS